MDHHNNQNDNKEEKVKDIIEELVSEDDDNEVDIDAVMSLGERIDDNPNERKEALYVIEDIFKNGPSFMILKAIKLLETLVKNCSQKFHFDVASKDFQDSILKLLDRKRKKKSFFKSIKQNVKNWEQIEQKALYLIQLWYDTFMMHEGEFVHIMNNYKLLRKEGVQFPERETNEVHMIKFKGMKSPIFQVLEEQQMQKSGTVPKNKREQLITQPSKSDYAKKFEINPSNLEKLVDNLQLLGAIVDGAQFPEDLQTDYCQEIVMFLKSFKTKIMIINSQNQIDETLGNKKKEILEFYKQTRIVLKNYESKSLEVDQFQQAMQESALENHEKTNHTRKLKNISIAPPPSKGGLTTQSSQITIPKVQSTSEEVKNISQSPKQSENQSAQQIPQQQQQNNDENQNKQNNQKQSNNLIDLLDLEDEQTLPQIISQQQPISQPQQQQQQQQQYNQAINQNYTQNQYNNLNQIPQQQQYTQSVNQNNQQIIPPAQNNMNNNVDLFADFNPQQPNSQTTVQQQNQQQKNQEDDDDFWGEIATRK